jgi:hypothetical protein
VQSPAPRKCCKEGAWLRLIVNDEIGAISHRSELPLFLNRIWNRIPRHSLAQFVGRLFPTVRKRCYESGIEDMKAESLSDQAAQN